MMAARQLADRATRLGDRTRQLGSRWGHAEVMLGSRLRCGCRAMRRTGSGLVQDWLSSLPVDSSTSAHYRYLQVVLGVSRPQG